MGDKLRDMDELYERVTNKLKEFRESSRSDVNLKKLVKYLYEDCGFTMKEAYKVCEDDLKSLFDEDQFMNAALDIKLENIPRGGYIDNKGFTVIYGSEENC